MTLAGPLSAAIIRRPGDGGAPETCPTPDKKAFRILAAAQSEIDYQRRRFGEEPRAYLCDGCRWWHIATKENALDKGRRRNRRFPMNASELARVSKIAVEDAFCRALEAHGQRTFGLKGKRASGTAERREKAARWVHARKSLSPACCLACDLARFQAWMNGTTIAAERREMRAAGVRFDEGGKS